MTEQFNPNFDSAEFIEDQRKKIDYQIKVSLDNLNREIGVFDEASSELLLIEQPREEIDRLLELLRSKVKEVSIPSYLGGGKLSGSALYYLFAQVLNNRIQTAVERRKELAPEIISDIISKIYRLIIERLKIDEDDLRRNKLYLRINLSKNQDMVKEYQKLGIID